MLRFYFAVACTAYRRQLIYRWANFAGLFTNIFFGIIISSVMVALYQNRPVTAGYNLREVLSYIWMTQALIMVVLPFNWVDLMLTIRTGEIVTDLNKPCDFFCYWCSRELGRSVYYFCFRALPIYLAGFLLYGVEYGTGWLSLPAFLLCLALGTVTGVVFRVLLNLTAFWLLEARSVITLGTTVAQFFTGNYIPVAFFPGWLYALASWLPFFGMMNAPSQVFVGKLAGMAYWSELAVQLAWLLLLIVVVRLIMAVATRRVVVQGG